MCFVHRMFDIPSHILFKISKLPKVSKQYEKMPLYGTLNNGGLGMINI